ncbi:Amino acid ABC transporter, periplasmic amino acid-binding protein [uncultured delta proteobacterium]|uniref:Amino acid ABC transporter, periplasmic amino acid-binding protein n=1 Tax=uncultured delta proteobacterium TaxID=34034 RepID=A0A212K401_9DELT|nr:Amino acid ABC transporter, periplasmic amino acid-binding protein [uncultured delta proteobacterium]
MRKRLMTLAFAVAFTALSATGALAAAYVNGIDANYPPFAYVDKSGKPAGFDVEAMDWVAKTMGFTVTHKPMDWNGIIPDLLAKKIDMVCSGMSISPERAARVTFSEPYFTIRKVLVVGEKSTLTPDDILKGKKRLGVQRGTNEAEWLAKNRDEKGWNYTLGYYDSAPMAVEDLLNGRLDAAGMDSAPAEDIINRAKRPVKIVGEFAPEDNFGVAMRNEDTELHKLINEGFKRLKADPYWQELQKKYLSDGK